MFGFQFSTPIAFTRRRTAEDLWGYCRGCYYAGICMGGCTWTAHSLFGRPGNNPMCHYRARGGGFALSLGGRPADAKAFESLAGLISVRAEPVEALSFGSVGRRKALRQAQGERVLAKKRQGTGRERAMADYRATIDWRSDGGFREGRYSRAHSWRFDGGALVPASSSPHVVQPPLSDPAGVDPEEALVASVSSCHMLWFLHLARDSGFDVSAYRDEAVGRMGKDDRGRMAMIRIVLRPRIDFAGQGPDPDTLARLHHEAHERCFIANSLRTEIVVE